MEEEPKPRYSWSNDAEGWFIKAKTNAGNYDLRDSNTLIFRHDKEHNFIDHIFRVLDTDGDRMTGIYIWRHSIPDFFDEFCDDLVNHGFDEDYSEVPDDHDVEKWEETTGRNYRKEVTETIVRMAMSNIDHEWAYFAEEWEDGA